MSVIVRIGQKKAILCASEWRCADLRLEVELQTALETWIAKTGGPPLKETDPDHFAAAAMAGELGFEVMSSVKPKGKAAQTSYWKRRQLPLPFFT